jgi:aconitate hydratase
MINYRANDSISQIIELPVTCCFDTEEEVSAYKAGGVLQCFAQDFLEGQVA